MLIIQIAEFKIFHYQMRAISYTHQSFLLYSNMVYNNLGVWRCSPFMLNVLIASEVTSVIVCSYALRE
jgi:hypothetical protein